MKEYLKSSAEVLGELSTDVQGLDKAEAERRGLNIEIQVDGGINGENAKDAISAGATILVAGSSVFGKTDRRAAIDALRNAD